MGCSPKSLSQCRLTVLVEYFICVGVVGAVVSVTDTCPSALYFPKGTFMSISTLRMYSRKASCPSGWSSSILQDYSFSNNLP